MDTSLERVDEFMHISRRMRRIALQSAVGGMTVSLLCMFIAAAGYLHPVAGAIVHLIDNPEATAGVAMRRMARAKACGRGRMVMLG